MNYSNLNKVIGYVLLFVGILLIAVPLYQTYAIFTGKTQPPAMFKQAEVVKNNNPSSFDIQQQVQNAMNNLLPAESINRLLNLSAWLILSFILMFGGRQLSGIGIKLIKE